MFVINLYIYSFIFKNFKNEKYPLWEGLCDSWDLNGSWNVDGVCNVVLGFRKKKKRKKNGQMGNWKHVLGIDIWMG